MPFVTCQPHHLMSWPPHPPIIRPTTVATYVQLGRVSLRALQLVARPVAAVASGAPPSVLGRASAVAASPTSILAVPVRHLGVMDKVRETLSAQKDKKMNEKRRTCGLVAGGGKGGREGKGGGEGR